MLQILSKFDTGHPVDEVVCRYITDVLEGYQIAYSTSKTFKSGVKTIHLGADKTTSTIKHLKAKKNYYVRIRTYSKLGNIIVYSGWSSIKNTKTK